MVEQSQSQLDELRKQLQAAEETTATSKAKLEETQKELERALPFEKQVKEQKLLIGKLQHNAVTLNDHLTKALRLLKKGKPEDNVDRYEFPRVVIKYTRDSNSLVPGKSSPITFSTSWLLIAPTPRNSKFYN